MSGDEEAGEVFIVEKILDRKYDHKKKQYVYLIKWLGYDLPSDNTWEVESNLNDCAERLQEYFARVKKKNFKRVILEEDVEVKKASTKKSSKLSGSSTSKATNKRKANCNLKSILNSANRNPGLNNCEKLSSLDISPSKNTTEENNHKKVNLKEIQKKELDDQIPSTSAFFEKESDFLSDDSDEIVLLSPPGTSFTIRSSSSTKSVSLGTQTDFQTKNDKKVDREVASSSTNTFEKNNLSSHTQLEYGRSNKSSKKKNAQNTLTIQDSNPTEAVPQIVKIIKDLNSSLVMSPTDINIPESSKQKSTTEQLEKDTDFSNEIISLNKQKSSEKEAQTQISTANKEEAKTKKRRQIKKNIYQLSEDESLQFCIPEVDGLQKKWEIEHVECIIMEKNIISEYYAIVKFKKSKLAQKIPLNIMYEEIDDVRNFVINVFANELGYGELEYYSS